jgi:putative peptidoglycan lipid II flippase
LSTQFEHDDQDGFALTSARTLRAIVVAGGLGAAGVAATSRPMADLMVGGAPGPDATSILQSALVAFAGGVLGYAVLSQVSRVLFARHLGRDASWLIGGAWLIAVTLAALTAASNPPAETLTWLGVCVSAALLVAAAAAVLRVRHVVGAAAVTRVWRSVGSVLVAGALAAVAGTWIADALSPAPADANSSWGSALVIVVVVAMAVVGIFAAVMALLSGDDLRALASRLRRRALDPAAPAEQSYLP